MRNTILIVCTITNVIVTLIALIFVFKVDVTWTGPLGDTFGGLLSPLIGGISIYFIYKTFEAQREQLEDQKKSNEETIAIQRKQLEDQKITNEVQRKQLDEQREQYHVNRITDIIYLQLERINESIKAQSFIFPDIAQQEAYGFAGLYSFNGLLREQQLNEIYLLDDSHTELYKLIVKNVNQLIGIYESISTAVVIINNLLNDVNLNATQTHDLKSLLVLNMGNSIRDNMDYLNKYIEFYRENSTELDSIWYMS